MLEIYTVLSFTLHLADCKAKGINFFNLLLCLNHLITGNYISKPLEEYYCKWKKKACYNTSTTCFSSAISLLCNKCTDLLKI